MTKIICDICGCDIVDERPYQLSIYTSSELKYSGKRRLNNADICECCANDLFNYIDTMKKVTRAKL